MTELFLHVAFLLLPITALPLLRGRNLSPLTFVGIILLAGAALSLASIMYYSKKQVQFGNNIDVGSVLLITVAAIAYLIVLPLIIFTKKKKLR